MGALAPIVPYYGAKWRVVDWIVERLPPHTTCVDHFGGSGAIIFSKEPSRFDVYNDRDGEVVNFFRVLRERPADLEVAILLTPYARDEQQLALCPGGSDLERARRFFVRAWQTHGGPQRSAWRTTRLARAGSTPLDVWQRVLARIRPLVDRLRAVAIEHLDWRESVAKYDAPRCLHIFDPPYPASVRSYGNIYTHEMRGSDEHRELLETASSLEGAVVVCGYRSPLYDEALAGWARHEKHTRDRRSSRRTECLWVRAPTPV